VKLVGGLAGVLLRLVLFVALATAALLAGMPEAANARSERYPGFKRPAHGPSASERRAKAEKPAPAGPLIAVVSLARQRISIYGNSGLITQGAISSGQRGYSTPTGMFTILQKRRYHESNIYSGAPMPWMQRITWSGVALHAGVLPGYPASHGCIRMTHAFARELWGMTKVNHRVVVSSEDLEPVEIRHALLPAPTMTPAPATVTDARDGEQARTALASLAPESSAAGQSAEGKPKLLNPLERAKAAKAFAIADAAAKAKAAKEALALSAAKSAEGNKAIIALRDAEHALAVARRRVEAASEAVNAADTPDRVEKARTAAAAAEAQLAEASKNAEEAAALEAVKTPEAFAAARAAWEADSASETAAAAKKALEKADEPLSVFISRKTGRVYVRQGWASVHEAAVTFKDPEMPLGTHLYVAMGPRENGKAMRWLSVSMPPELRAKDDQRRTRRGDRHQPPALHSEARVRDTAASALERVELSEETRAFIADRVWTGATLIISEHGLGNETGVYTDFIVQTK
jgi:hypothetical protein